MLCLIERLGVVRAATDVFASFDIREHGANKVVANSFAPVECSRYTGVDFSERGTPVGSVVLFGRSYSA